MHHPDLPDPPKTAARRRLIRGALSAPALMTVCSGSAFAAASNMRCLANAANATTAPADWGRGTPDTFLRVQLWQVTTCLTTPLSTGADANIDERKNALPTDATKAGGGGSGKKPQQPAPTPACTSTPVAYYIKGSDLSLYVRGAGMPSNAEYLRIDPISFVTMGAPVPVVVAPPAIESQGYVEKYVAIRLDKDGALVGIGAPATGGQGGMVGMSCWLSAFPPP